MHAFTQHVLNGATQPPEYWSDHGPCLVLIPVCLPFVSLVAPVYDPNERVKMLSSLIVVMLVTVPHTCSSKPRIT